MKHGGHGVRAAHQVASLLLTYPDEGLRERLPLLRQAVTAAPARAAAPLGRMLDHVAATAPGLLAAHYVDVFDLRRRCCPYLTYYTHGDTRRRGLALLRFRRAYRAAGMELAGDELPDHLAVVLEFSARGHVGEATALLAEHRVGLELLWHATLQAASPFADVVEAVRATLPEPAPSQLAAVRRLAREGPPVEEVGLQASGPPAPAPGPPPAARQGSHP